MPLIVFSRENLAGETMAGQLIEHHNFQQQEPLESGDGKYSWRNWKNREGLQLVELTTMHIFSDYLKDYPLFNESDLLVVASTHKSGAGVPALTAHACGNWGEENKLGGNPRELAFASAKALKSAYTFLSKNENAVEGFPFHIEATHHGPTTLKAPVLFMEVGSSEKEWGLPVPAKKMAEGILHVCRNWMNEKHPSIGGKVVLGFGGMHYLGKFAQLEAEGYAFSHVASKHLCASVTQEMVEQAVAKTREKVEGAFVEKSSLKSVVRKSVTEALEGAGVSYELI